MKDIKDPSGTLRDEKNALSNNRKYTKRNWQHVRHVEEIINEHGNIAIEMNQNEIQNECLC